MKQDVYNIVKNSLSYPSGDNVQPFTFKFSKAATLKIFCEKEDEPGPFGAVTNYVALGCFLEVLNLRAQEASYSIIIDIPENFCENAQPVEIRFTKDGIIPESSGSGLAALIDKRHTDRRAYLKTPIENEIKNILAEVAAGQKINTAKLNFLTELSGKVIRQMCRVEHSVWSSFFCVQPILKSINYSLFRPKKTSGLNLKNLGVHPLLAFLGVLESRNKWIFRLMVMLGRPWINQIIFKNQILNSGGFILMTVGDQTQKSVIEAARLFCRMWIKICGKGYALQPISIVSLLLFSINQNPGGKRRIEPEILFSLNETAKMLKTEFSIGVDAEIMWMCRVGIPNGVFPDSALTGRKKMSEVWTEE